MKDRIQKYMDFKEINAGELAQLLDVQRSNISHILNGRNKPSAAFIEKMLLVFPDLNARWLLTGQGGMTNNTSVSNEGVADFSTKEDLQNKKKESREESPVTYRKPSEQPVSAQKKQDPPFDDDEVEKLVLLYRDGSFASFRKR